MCAAPGDLPAGGVQSYVPAAVDLAAHRQVALGQRGNPRDQLWELEGLGKVVVRPRLEAAEPVVGDALCGVGDALRRGRAYEMAAGTN